ncbi:hypothetical protein PPACK8108_LOCUS16267 [Phakopsora pachyrhizi]|uniref:Uncharacterized protein n=1 Tax=Phakopsora pachyrhizi TaxID=170000 RepID=A0AAV0B7U8_PHAPC|nr:hypothetical protein PPACK8108_LOCUS16267 [Phakopsora pachyrhizi]
MKLSLILKGLSERKGKQGWEIIVDDGRRGRGKLGYEIVDEEEERKGRLLTRGRRGREIVDEGEGMKTPSVLFLNSRTGNGRLRYALWDLIDYDEGEVPVKKFLKLILLSTVKTRKNDIISLTEGGVMIIVKRA